MAPNFVLSSNLLSIRLVRVGPARDTLTRPNRTEIRFEVGPTALVCIDASTDG